MVLARTMRWPFGKHGEIMMRSEDADIALGAARGSGG